MTEEKAIPTGTLFASYPEVVSLMQLGEMLNISRTTCYRLLKSRQLSYMQIGRKYLIPKDAVIQYVSALMN